MVHRTETKGGLAAEPDRLSALESLAGRLKAHLDASRAKVVDDCLSIYRNNEFVIMICGEISVGKSSFLNTLVGTDFLLTDQTETTAAITYIRSVDNPLAEPGHADEVKVTFRDASRAPEWVPMRDRARMRELTTSLSGNEVAIRTVEKAEVFLRRETLELPPEITIIDTPGLNGSESHSELTHSEMGKCHVALFLLDGSKFGTLTNREEFRRLCRYAPEVLFVVSKWDLSRGGYLGERPTREGLERVKREDFLPRLSDWMEGGELSTGDIYVVSCHEVEEARQSYGALDEDVRLATRLESLLPSEDNDFFRLQGRLGEIMHSSERRRVMYRRPLHTLLRLAEDRLQEVEGRLAEVDEVAFAREQEELRVRLESEQEELKAAFEEVRSFAEELCRLEKAELREVVREGCAKVSQSFMAELDTYPWRELCEVRTRKMLESRRRDLLRKHVEHPLLERQGMFERFLSRVLETEMNSGGDLFSRVGGDEVAAGISVLNEWRQAMERQLAELDEERSGHEERLEELEQELRSQETLLTSVKERLREEKTIQSQMESVRRAIGRLGPRPQVETWTESVRHRHPVFHEKTWWNPFSWFRDEVEWETSYEEETRTDSRARDEWDSRMAPLQQELEQLQGRLRPFAALKEQAIRLEAERKRLEKTMDEQRRRIEQVQERAAQVQGMRGAFERDEVLAECHRLWKAELSESFRGYEEADKRFEESVRNSLESYWLRRDLALRDYVAAMDRELERRRAASRASAGDYEALLRARSELNTLVSEFRSQLASLREEAFD